MLPRDPAVRSPAGAAPRSFSCLPPGRSSACCGFQRTELAAADTHRSLPRPASLQTLPDRRPLLFAESLCGRQLFKNFEEHLAVAHGISK